MSGLSDAEWQPLDDAWVAEDPDALRAAINALIAARAEQIAQQIEAAIEVREYATGLNWKARDAYATAKIIAARIARGRA